MAVYVVAEVTVDEIETLLSDNWDEKTNTEVPKPLFATSDVVRFDPSNRLVFPAHVNIMQEELTEEQVGHPYQHVRKRLPIVIDIMTLREVATNGATGRQYLYDVKDEIRRILYANMHSLVPSWEMIRYVGFKDIYEESIGQFHGQVRFVLEADGVSIPGELVDSDDFNRSAGAIGSDWNSVVGTWEVATGGIRAVLASATANAHVRWVGKTLKASHTLRVQVITSANMDAGILFRWQDSSNYWVARLEEESSVRYLRTYTNTGGSLVRVMETRMSSTSLNWSSGDQVELGVAFVNSWMEISVNGCAVQRRLDSYLQNETDHGLYSNSDQNTQFDDWLIFEAGGSGR